MLNAAPFYRRVESPPRAVAPNDQDATSDELIAAAEWTRENSGRSWTPRAPQ